MLRSRYNSPPRVRLRDVVQRHRRERIRLLLAFQVVAATLLIVAIVVASASLDPRRPGGAPAPAAPAIIVPVPQDPDTSSVGSASSIGSVGGNLPGPSSGSPPGAVIAEPAPDVDPDHPRPVRQTTQPPPAPSSRVPTPPATTAARQSSGGCLHATHHLNTQWPGGLQAQFAIANCGAAPVTGWSVTVSFSGGVTIQAWNAQPGGGSTTVHFGPMSYDATIAPGATVTFGFNATWSGGAPRAITGCALANGSCS